MASGNVPARIYFRQAWLCLLALSALVLLAACGGSGTTSTSSTPAATATQAGNTQTVMIITDSSGSFAFSPASLTIKAGTAVMWKIRHKCHIPSRAMMANHLTQALLTR